MNFLQTTKRQFLCLTFLLAVPAALGVEAPEKYAVKHGAPERHGRAWVERSEFSAPARPGGRLVLRADLGAVVVRTGAVDKLEGQLILRAYTSHEKQARNFFAGYDVDVRSLDNGSVYIAARAAGDYEGSTSLGAEFDITVPARFNLDVETQGGDINVSSALEGEVRATTAGGDIRTRDVSGLLHAETAGGSIALGNVGQRLEARTAGGDIRVGNVKGEAVLETSGGEITSGRVDGSVHAETAGGDVIIEGAGGPVTAQTAGGQIRLGRCSGSVHAETSGGSIWCQGARGRVDADTAGGSIDLFQCRGAIRASTAAGRILAQIEGGRKAFSASELENSMGDVEVFLPIDLALTIDAGVEMAAGHAILSDFPLTIQGSGEDDPDRELHARGELNGGGEVLRIRTVNGNIQIRKMDTQIIEQLKKRQSWEWSQRTERRTENEERRKIEKHRESDDEE